jgi:hypothetical protein
MLRSSSANLGRVRITTARTNKTLPLHVPVLDFDRLSPLGVQQTRSAFHPHQQRNAFRRRDARLQSRLFVPLECTVNRNRAGSRLLFLAEFLESRIGA